MRVHELKTWPAFFEAMLRGGKTFEVRRNDRDFAVGDTLVLMEWDPGPCAPGTFTGRKLERTVTYMMRGDQFGIEPGYCVLGIKEPTPTPARSERDRVIEELRAEIAQLTDEKNELARKLEERKLVERAKGIIMEREGTIEHLAYRKLQVMSQNTNLPMAHVAKTVIAEEQVRRQQG